MNTASSRSGGAIRRRADERPICPALSSQVRSSVSPAKENSIACHNFARTGEFSGANNGRNPRNKNSQMAKLHNWRKSLHAFCLWYLT